MWLLQYYLFQREAKLSKSYRCFLFLYFFMRSVVRTTLAWCSRQSIISLTNVWPCRIQTFARFAPFNTVIVKLIYSGFNTLYMCMKNDIWKRVKGFQVKRNLFVNFSAIASKTEKSKTHIISKKRLYVCKTHIISNKKVIDFSFHHTILNCCFQSIAFLSWSKDINLF